MNTPHVEFLGWNLPAIELVAQKLLNGLNNPATAAQYRRATVVVPTAESGRRLREYLAEKAGRPILIPNIILAHCLLPMEGPGIATEAETIAAWLQVLGAEGSDPVSQYAPLIPRRPDTHRERWAVGVAHKLMRLRTRLEQEEVTVDAVTHLLASHKQATEMELNKISPDNATLVASLKARLAVYASEQVRWRKLGELFSRVDALPGKPSVSALQANWVAQPVWPGQGRLLIVACVPEFSPQLRTALRHLNGRDGGRVEIWVHADAAQKELFDDYGMPRESAWADCDIDLPDGVIHMADDAVALGETARQLAGGLRSDEVVIATGDTAYTPALISAFGDCEEGWQLKSPEGRSLLTTDIGHLPGLLADYCSAQLDFFNSMTENSGMQELNAYLALLCNRALQCALGAPPAVQAGIQRHSEKLREILLPASVQLFCSYLNPDTPLPGGDYRELQYLAGSRSREFHAYAEAVAEFARACCRSESLSERLNFLAAQLVRSYTEEPLRRAVRSLCNAVRNLTAPAFAQHIQSPVFLLELLRYQTQETPLALRNAPPAETIAGDVLGWRELTFARGQRVIISAMHEGCIPEPIQGDDFLPESLCRELGIRHESFRTARDAYLLTALLHSRRGGEVHFLVARQNPDGTPVAPSTLLLRCGAALPERARALFAESATVSAPPAVPLCPLRPALPGPEQGGLVQPGMLESIGQLSPARSNPFADTARTYSPSLLSGFLQCPLSFWLNHLFGLDAGSVYDEDKSELESNECGTLVHAVLQHVVQAVPGLAELQAMFPAASGTTALAAALTEFAQQKAADEWSKVYMRGCDRHTQSIPMEIQLRNIEKCLPDFALRHVQDLQAGWRNICCERRLKPTFTLADGSTARFSMVADRIDFHAESGCWRIIDYKTSSGDKKPLKVHFDEVEDGENSPFYRFMNVGEYQFPLVEVAFGEGGSKYYRWKDVQLMLYAYGLRQLRAHELDSTLPDVPLASVMPELFYYNLQNKTQQMQCYPLIENGKLVSVPARGKQVGNFCHTPEQLLESAMQTVDSAIRMIRAGQCLFSAEALQHKSRPFSRLAANSFDRNAPRFGAISQQCDPRSMFNLPQLNI